MNKHKQKDNKLARHLQWPPSKVLKNTLVLDVLIAVSAQDAHVSNALL